MCRFFFTYAYFYDIFKWTIRKNRLGNYGNFVMDDEKLMEHINNIEVLAEKKKELARTTFRMIVLLVVAFFAIFAFVTKAWYVNSHAVGARNMSVISQGVDLALLQYDVYGYEKHIRDNEDGISEVSYSFFCDTNYDEVDLLTMAHFDAIQKDNQKTPIIIRAMVSGNSVFDKRPLTASIYRNSEQQELAGLSEIIDVKCAIIPNTEFAEFDEDADPEEVGEDVWQKAVNYFRNNQDISTQKFVNNDGTLKQSIHFDIDDYTEELESYENFIYIYFLIDYDEELILDYIHNNDFTDNIGTNGTTIKFINDLNTITVDLQ